MTGTIKKKMEKGFGFISSPELEKEIFFHMNNLVGVTFDQLQEGDTVTFDEDKGPAAINVQLADAQM
jgi:CspA family cold shock protein